MANYPKSGSDILSENLDMIENIGVNTLRDVTIAVEHKMRKLCEQASVCRDEVEREQKVFFLVVMPCSLSYPI